MVGLVQLTFKFKPLGIENPKSFIEDFIRKGYAKLQKLSIQEEKDYLLVNLVAIVGIDIDTDFVAERGLKVWATLKDIDFDKHFEIVDSKIIVKHTKTAFDKIAEEMRGEREDGR